MNDFPRYNKGMDTPAAASAVESAKNAITNGITSDQAIETLKVQSAQVTTEFLGWLKTAAADAGSFVAEQTPLFVKEFLTWHFYNACLSALMTLIPVFIFLWIFVAMRKWAKNFDNNKHSELNSTDAKILSFIPIVLIIPCLVWWTAPYVREAIKIKVAPRVYLVDWLSEAMTGHNVSDANSTGSARTTK